MKEYVITVLILVLLEYTLGAADLAVNAEETNVLILVLLEYTLGEQFKGRLGLYE